MAITLPDDFNPSKFASDMQARTRKEKNFEKVEADLPQYKPHAPAKRLSGLDSIKLHVSKWNPFARPVTRGDTIWVLDNTAFRPSRLGSWQAEFVAAVFESDDDSKVVDLVSGLAKVLGVADDAEEKRTMQKRLMPFVWDIRIGKTININQEGSRKQLKLGPTRLNGVLSQVIKVGSYRKGSLVTNKAVVGAGVEGLLQSNTSYAGSDGWGIISDIDDTIKITSTSDPMGILKETFVNEPRPIEGMPELYKAVQAMLPQDSPWFYLSASPYNLYPFLRGFRDQYYPPGTMILRDQSWRSIAGLLAALTVNTEEYKVDRMKKVNSWLPNRKMIVIGDSTQSDPEAYGEIFRTFPGWIRLILIRKAQDSSMFGLHEKNEPERFERAFKDIPKESWHVFEDPAECVSIIQQTLN